MTSQLWSNFQQNLLHFLKKHLKCSFISAKNSHCLFSGVHVSYFYLSEDKKSSSCFTYVHSDSSLHNNDLHFKIIRSFHSIYLTRVSISRLCGRPFCYYCCSNTVSTQQGGNRERCCRDCYNQHSAVVERHPQEEVTNSTPGTPFSRLLQAGRAVTSVSGNKAQILYLSISHTHTH